LSAIVIGLHRVASAVMLAMRSGAGITADGTLENVRAVAAP
jgi:hypothetical protein